MNLQGIFAPLTTPFSSDVNVSLPHLRENIGRYNKTGLAGYAINGSTSESVLLRWDEAVSYTHLDVYKRQGCDSGERA